MNDTTGDLNLKKMSELEFPTLESCRSIYTDESYNLDDEIEIF